MNPDDPLAALRDIQLPPEPAWWPPAPGWWLLSALLAVAAAALAVAWLKNRARDASRRAAIAAIAGLRARHAGGAPAGPIARELNSLLKRYALSRYPAEQIAGLSGKQWARFLARGRNGKAFSAETGAMLARAPYDERAVRESELPALLTHGEAWVKHNPGRRAEGAAVQPGYEQTPHTPASTA